MTWVSDSAYKAEGLVVSLLQLLLYGKIGTERVEVQNVCVIRTNIHRYT